MDNIRQPENGGILQLSGQEDVQVTFVQRSATTILTNPPGGSVNTIAKPMVGAAATVLKKRKCSVSHYGNGGTAIYLFAGPRQKSTIGALLRKAGWVVTEVDILQGGKSHDLTLQAIQEKFLSEIGDEI